MTRREYLQSPHQGYYSPGTEQLRLCHNNSFLFLQLSSDFTYDRALMLKMLTDPSMKDHLGVVPCLQRYDSNVMSVDWSSSDNEDGWFL